MKFQNLVPLYIIVKAKTLYVLLENIFIRNIALVASNYLINTCVCVESVILYVYNLNSLIWNPYTNSKLFLHYSNNFGSISSQELNQSISGHPLAPRSASAQEVIGMSFPSVWKVLHHVTKKASRNSYSVMRMRPVEGSVHVTRPFSLNT